MKHLCLFMMVVVLLTSCKREEPFRKWDGEQDVDACGGLRLEVFSILLVKRTPANRDVYYPYARISDTNMILRIVRALNEPQKKHEMHRVDGQYALLLFCSDRILQNVSLVKVDVQLDKHSGEAITPRGRDKGLYGLLSSLPQCENYYGGTGTLEERRKLDAWYAERQRRVEAERE